MYRTLSSKPCGNYEREWKGGCVDRNLKDTWLEELNSLVNFELCGICEGHPAKVGRGEQRPSVSLGLKTVRYVRLGDKVILPFLTAAKEIFQATFTSPPFQARINLDIISPNTQSWDAIYNLVIYIEPTTIRFSGDESEKSNWFDEVVRRAIKFDGQWGSKVNQFLTPGEWHKY